MKYTITESGIHFHDEPDAPTEQPITRAEIMAAIHKISAGIEALDDVQTVGPDQLQRVQHGAEHGITGTYPDAAQDDSGATQA